MDPAAFAKFLQVALIDLVLAGDNAVVIAMAAAGLSAGTRGRAILLGTAAATGLRVLFAILATQLLAIVGLLLAGGLLLLWVCWKMWLEIRQQRPSGNQAGTLDVRSHTRQKTLRQAVVQIVIADASMSLDNVLAVAGAAQRQMVPLIFGLVLSVAMMGLASAVLARLLQRNPWISYLGLAIILYVAARMTIDGANELIHHGA